MSSRRDRETLENQVNSFFHPRIKERARCQFICLFTGLSPLFHFPWKTCGNDKSQTGEKKKKKHHPTSTAFWYFQNGTACEATLLLSPSRVISSDTSASHFDKKKKNWRNDASHLFKNYTSWPKRREATITAQNTVTCLLLIVPHLWGSRRAHCRLVSALSPGLLLPSPPLTPWQPGIPFSCYPSPRSLTPHPAISSFTKPLINPSPLPWHWKGAVFKPVPASSTDFSTVRHVGGWVDPVPRAPALTVLYYI